jgi:hypothetical protein
MGGAGPAPITTKPPRSGLLARKKAALPRQDSVPASENPYVLVGTVDQIVQDLCARRARWGISYYVVHEPYMDAFAPVVTRLAGQ